MGDDGTEWVAEGGTDVKVGGRAVRVGVRDGEGVAVNGIAVAVLSGLQTTIVFPFTTCTPSNGCKPLQYKAHSPSGMTIGSCAACEDVTTASAASNPKINICFFMVLLWVVFALWQILTARFTAVFYQTGGGEVTRLLCE